MIASLPGRLLEKCMAGEGLLAQMLIDKYVDHLPIDRQLKRFARHGVKIAQSTANDWVQRTLFALTGLYELHKQMVLASGYLHADETPLKVLDDDKKGSTHRGYYWVYHSSELKMVLFEYQPGRGREGPQAMLKDYKGWLQTDGYQVYDAFEKQSGIRLLHCMAHSRRYYIEAVDSDRERSEKALAWIGQLYQIERDIQTEGLTGEEVVKCRKKLALPILLQLKEWMTAQYPVVLPRSPIGKAIGYCLPRWDILMLYVEDSRLRIDNNAVENQIRPVALGRKNYLFAGGHEAAQKAAMLEIEPYKWLKDVLQTINLYNSSNLSSLLPINWKIMKEGEGI